MTLGKRICKLRTERKVSQELLAEHMDVSRQAVSKWENDISSPDTNNLIRLAEFFDVSVEYLATGKVRQENLFITHDSVLPPIMRRISFVLFILALISHCIGLFSGAFTAPLIPVFPYLWYGENTWAIVLNIFTVLFTIGWISLVVVANIIDRKCKARQNQIQNHFDQPLS